MAKPAYIHDYKDRHGKRRVYFRKGDFTKDLIRFLPYQSQAWNTAYAEALTEAAGAVTQRHSAGTLGRLIGLYYKYSEYPTFAEDTKRTYKLQFEKIRAAHGDRLVKDIERIHIRAIVNSLSDRPQEANLFIRYVKQLLYFAIEMGWRKDNPAARFKKLKVEGDGWSPWTLAMISQYRDYWAIGTRQRIALELFTWTAQRVKDVAVMHRNSIDDNVIEVVQHKTGARIWIPLHPDLQAAVEAFDHKGLYLLESALSKPYSPKSLGMRFSGWAQEAGVPKGYSAHGLRKTMGDQLAENDATAKEIMAFLGHKTMAEADRYTRGADQKRLARQALEKLRKGTEQKRNLANPKDKLANPPLNA